MAILDPLTASYAEVQPVLDGLGPVWMVSLRREALDAFAKVGLPTTKDEEFKYLPLHALQETAFGPAYGATVDAGDVHGLPYGDADFATLTFVNGQYAPELSNPSGLPEGVFVGNFEEAFEQHPDRLRARLGSVATYDGKLGSTNDPRFVWLNQAYLDDGAFVLVPKGVHVDRPIHLRFLIRADHGPMACHPRIVIELEEGARAKVLETHQTLGNGAKAFVNVVVEGWVDRYANLELIKVQDHDADAIHLANVFVQQWADSVFTSTQASLGGQISRTDLNVYVAGTHAETWLNGTYLGLGNQIIDNHTRIDHAVPNCRSFEVYKGVLGGRASGVFNGKIFVYEDAQKTDAKQTNQALLLSPEASVNTKPQLEIFADDVKCTHGATVGQIEGDALFYLRSRGIPESEARNLLVYAFAAEVLDRVTIEPLRNALEQTIYERLRIQNPW